MSGGRAVFAVVLAIGVAGVVAAVLTGPNDPAATASSLDEVVAQLRTSFGNDYIAGAGVHGSRNERPSFFELDDQNGKTVSAASWLPGANGSGWVRRGLPDPFVHL